MHDMNDLSHEQMVHVNVEVDVFVCLIGWFVVCLSAAVIVVVIVSVVVALACCSYCHCRRHLSYFHCSRCSFHCLLVIATAAVACLGVADSFCHDGC